MNFSPLILMASLGKPFSDDSLAATVTLAKSLGINAKPSDEKERPPVHLFTIARIFGSSFGMPNPGLMPNKREWQEQHDLLAAAQKSLKKSGVAASALVVSSRNPIKRIIAEAKHVNATHLVIEAPPRKHWLIAHLFWDQQAYAIGKRAQKLGIEVRLVTA
ncbi:MAG: hypothetical protein QM537_04285 [Candidatus Symbiobacter sp.]|nr:hypothetical protein [Candidatus Symbiobacter sp.]